MEVEDETQQRRGGPRAARPSGRDPGRRADRLARSQPGRALPGSAAPGPGYRLPREAAVSRCEGRSRLGRDDAPAGFTCAHYEPLAASRRCRSYLDGGGCARPDEFMCVEWLNANAPKSPPGGSSSAADATEGEAQPCSGPGDHPLGREPRFPSSAEISSLRDLGVEVALATADAGEIWLVPAYTRQSRRELRFDHAATLAALCRLFPGTSVRSLKKTHR